MVNTVNMVEMVFLLSSQVANYKTLRNISVCKIIIQAKHFHKFNIIFNNFQVL